MRTFTWCCIAGVATSGVVMALVATNPWMGLLPLMGLPLMFLSLKAQSDLRRYNQERTELVQETMDDLHRWMER